MTSWVRSRAPSLASRLPTCVLTEIVGAGRDLADGEATRDKREHLGLAGGDGIERARVACR
ncbi:hypothetical protein [uncultured Aeromicrobium sp.]|uniref:hypothetical protein n=1 Tax=uncultured Aeromicrobium sp. TaxID=337820 RepID=UPI0025F59730|nr:hypothetical protein [uncultured Aeromicrobium sp.]